MHKKSAYHDIETVLDSIEVATVATASGEDIRTRVMHYAVDEDFNFYVSSVKGDPKTIQLTHNPSISVLVQQTRTDFVQMEEVEVTGRAEFVRDDEERARALEVLAKRSPVVGYLAQTGALDVLECVKIVPQLIKFRVAGEVVQGKPPKVLDFPENREAVGDWKRLKRKSQAWLAALRVAFLTASAVPVLLGTAVAWMMSGSLDYPLFALTFIAGLSLQAGTNVLNDYFDNDSGNDPSNREFVRPFSGGSRVIQLGLLSPLEMLTGGLLLCVLGSVLGLYLAWVAGWPVIVLGVIGLVSGVFYTGWPFNWASRGMGELLVGLNYGVLMTLGAYFVQTKTLSWVPVVASLPVALFITAVLYINEFPDYVADGAVNKRTLVVRLGRSRAVGLFIVLIALAYISLVAGVVMQMLPTVTLIGLMTVPLSVRAVQVALKHYASSFDLIPANALTIICHLATGLLLVLAFAWQVLQFHGLVYQAILAVAFTLAVGWMYRHVERQRAIFHGVKQAVK
ncbi:MAG: UbiA family prenyltransferase [Chloroflexi bacterium]|nr:UbiA family prenyltransferase [Chloroflexota bacterium]